jgi:hypothetical protein
MHLVLCSPGQLPLWFFIWLVDASRDASLPPGYNTGPRSGRPLYKQAASCLFWGPSATAAGMSNPCHTFLKKRLVLSLYF